MFDCGTVRIAQEALQSWAMTLRIFLIVSVVAATPTILGFVVGSRALLLFMR